MLRILTIFTFISIPTLIFAQNDHHNHNDHDHHSHGIHQNEFGVALMGAWLLAEQELAPSIHTHYIHYRPHSAFGLGVGFEKIFDEHSHNTLGLVASYRPKEQLSFNLSPGVSFAMHDHLEFSPALHIEVLYEFLIGHLHLGPIVEYAWGPEDSHLSVGLHIGLGY